MPTQEQINAANTELQIANDNYAALSDRYNRYQQALQAYANASPEAQARARGAMQSLLDNYNQLRLDMYTAEDRVNQAQSAVNNLNSVMAQPQASTGGQRRRTITQPQFTPTIHNINLRSAVNTNAPTEYAPAIHNINLQRSAAPDPSAYTEYVPQYRNNTLAGMINNAGGTIRNDWQNVGRDRRYTVRPRISGAANAIYNGYKNTFVDAPSRFFDNSAAFLLGAPQRNI